MKIYQGNLVICLSIDNTFLLGARIVRLLLLVLLLLRAAAAVAAAVAVGCCCCPPGNPTPPIVLVLLLIRSKDCQIGHFVTKLKSQIDHLRPLNATVRCVRRPPIEGRVCDHLNAAILLLLDLSKDVCVLSRVCVKSCVCCPIKGRVCVKPCVCQKSCVCSC